MKTLLIVASASLMLSLSCAGAKPAPDDTTGGGATTSEPAKTSAPPARKTIGCLATAAPKGRGWLEIGPPNLMGSLTEAQVLKVVTSCQAKFVKCYQDELAHHSEFEGEIDLTYTIEASGKVEVAVVGRNTCPSDQIGPCVAKTMEATFFPPARDSTSVEQSFKFAAEAPAAE